MRIKKSQLRKIIQEEIGRSGMLLEWVPDQDTPPPPDPSDTRYPKPEVFDPAKAAENMDIQPFVEEAKKIVKVLINREWKGQNLDPRIDENIEAIRKAWNHFTNDDVLREANPEIGTRAEWAARLMSLGFAGWEIQTLYKLGFTAKGAASLNALAAAATQQITAGSARAVAWAGIRLVLLYLLAFLGGWIIGEAVDEGFEGWWRYEYWKALNQALSHFPVKIINRFLQKGSFEPGDSIRFIKLTRDASLEILSMYLERDPYVADFIKRKSTDWAPSHPGRAQLGFRPLIKMIMEKHIKLFIITLTGYGPGTGYGLVAPLLDKIRELEVA